MNFSFGTISEMIDNMFPFRIGQIVYLKTDTEQLPRIIYCIEIHHNSNVMYKVCQGTETSIHYEFEMSSEKNLITKFENE